MPAQYAKLTKAPRQISSSSIAFSSMFLLFTGSVAIFTGQYLNTNSIFLKENDDGFVNIIIKGIYVTATINKVNGSGLKAKKKKCIPMITIDTSNIVKNIIFTILSGMNRRMTHSG